MQVVPVPDLSALEPAVREQLENARLILKETLADEQAEAGNLAESFGSLGQLYHTYDLRSAARVCYQNALTLAGEDFRWNYLLAYLSQTEGDSEWASFFYQRARSLRPEDVPSAVHLAEVRLQQGQEEEAAQLYQEALRQDANCGAAHFGLGQIALSQRRYEDAAKSFERALQLVPAATQIHYSLAMAYRGQGKLAEAQQHLAQRGEAGIRVEDPLVDGLSQLRTGEVVFLLMGHRAYKAGDYASAEAYFQKAVDAAPTSYRALTNLGTVLAARGDEAGALERFEAAAAAGSESTSLHYNLAVLLNRRGDYQKAVERLEFILDREPGDQPVRLELARSLEALGQTERALQELRKATELRPEDPEARFREASLLVTLSRFGEAIERLTFAHQLFPKESRFANALARLLAACPDRSLRNGEKALQLAQATFEAEPTPFYGETVGLAFAEAGQCAEALQWQQWLIAQAAEAGAKDWVGRLQGKLSKYNEQPCRP